MPIRKMRRNDLLERLVFGRVDAESVDDLPQRFLRTRDFQQLMTRDCMLVLGPKGTGKSAIFELLHRFEDEARHLSDGALDRKVLVTGTGILDLSEVSTDDIEALRREPDFDFSKLWRLYIAVKVATALQDRAHYSRGPVRELLKAVGTIDDLRILPTMRFLWRTIISPNPPDIASVGAYGVTLNLGGKGGRAIDVMDLLDDANSMLEVSDSQAWILFDKIDEIYPQDRAVRKSALEGLMTAAMSIRRTAPRIAPKVFLRTDIWATLEFTNKSHLLDKTLTLSWSRRQITALLAKGAASDEHVRALMMRKEPAFDAMEAEGQPNVIVKRALNPVLTPKIRHRRTDYDSIPFIYDRIRDSRGDAFPREAILWMNWAASMELNRRVPGAEGDPLVTGTSIVSSYSNVSNARCEAYLSEFPDYREHFSRFEGQVGPAFTRDELNKLMEGLTPSGGELYRQLCEIGMLQALGANASRAERFEVPLLYRHGLGLSTPDRG